MRRPLGRGEWARQFPPLVVLAAAIVLAVFTLPSGLILPQASPTQTLEYAPVPPNGQSQPGGNASNLGLGTTGTLGANGVGGVGLPPLPASGTNPTNKECVGNPPRQTEDPLSPPCVAYFSGSNGCGTYTGVSCHEIVVLFLVDPFTSFANCGGPSPKNYYEDLLKPPDSNDNTCVPVLLRAWQAYFNYRFQTYGRTVHFWIYWATMGQSPAQREADASDNISRLHPFAVVMPPSAFGIQGYLDSYQARMNQAGVFVFTSLPFSPESTYRQFAPLLWGYAPAAEEQARGYATFICQKVKGFAVSSSPEFKGRTRVYGLVETTDPSVPLIQAYQRLAAGYVKSECGITFKDTATYPIEGQIIYTGAQSAQYNSYAAPDMARFASEGITTIIWPTGTEINFSAAAQEQNYYPEWITGGDGVHSDGWDTTLFQNQSEWADAWVVTYEPLVDNGVGSEACRTAYQSQDQSATAETSYPCSFYPAIFQLFVGIQVAGPHLDASSMDEGYHAIPARRSTNPEVPACYYDAGDYTCVKDATYMWWDPNMSNPYANGVKGCWRMPDGGARFLPGQWPAGDVSARKNPSQDPCNGFVGGTSGTTPAG